MPLANTLGLIHLIFSLIALTLGTGVIAARKGTRLHRTFGHLYFASMLGANATALGLYRLTGQFNAFHAAALVSLLSLLAGLAPAVIRRPRRMWLPWHSRFMTGTYVGLLAAAAAEVATRIPGLDFGLAAGLTSGVVIVAGIYLIHTRIGTAIVKAQRNIPRHAEEFGP